MYIIITNENEAQICKWIQAPKLYFAKELKFKLATDLIVF